MKNRKRLSVAGAVLLALVAVGLLCLWNGVRTDAARADAAPRRVASGEATSSSLLRGSNNPLPTRRAAASAGAASLAASATAAPAAQTPTRRGTLPFVLKSKTAFTKPLRLAAEALGAKTVSSLSRKSLLVEATPEARARLKADARFEDVAEFAPAEKIQPALAALVEKGEKTVEVSIVSLDAIDRETVVAALTAAGGEMLKGCINEGDTIRAKIPSDAVATLAGCGEVRWMETFVRPRILNDLAVKADCMNVVEVWNTHGLTGAGQGVSTSDTGIDSGDPATLHEDLRNRVREMKVVDGCNTNDVNGHGTHTAGSIVGDGTKSGGQIRGTAYGADLYAWFCGGTGGSIDTPETLDLLYRNGGAWTSYVHSASWGSGYNPYYPSYSQCGQYNSMSEENDRYVWKHPDFLPVYAAGNDRDYLEAGAIATPASAKNVLAVGATQSSRIGYDGGWGNGNPKKTAGFSSGGPCLDGRIKPDLAAPGVGILSTRSYGVKYSYGTYNDFYAYDSGTSMACPLTAGAVALVRQWLVEQKGFEDEDGKRPTAALMKAVIMGGAKDASVPNNDQGWGRVDLEETLFPSGGRAVKLIDRIPFAAGYVTNIVIETTAEAPLDVQLVWVDYPGSSSGDQSVPRLVNDLDLTVEPYGISGDFCYGNGGDGPDTVNNAESVRIATAAAGKYIITVDCKSILHDHTEGGAAALYIRGAFDPDANPEAPKCVHLEKLGEDFFGLDTALAAVRDDGEKVSIMRPTRLQKAVTIPTNCTLVADSVDPSVVPVVRCANRGLVTVPENVTFAVSGVAFTNDCAGFAVGGRLAATNNVSFENLATVSVLSSGVAAFTNAVVSGDAPALTVDEGGAVAASGVQIGGAAADWSVAGTLRLAGSLLASNQTVTVVQSGNLTLEAGVTNLTKLTLEAASKGSLTLAGALVQSIEVTAPNAYAEGTVFGSYTGDLATATESARLLVDVLDPEGELGGKAYSEDGTLRWAIVEAPEEAAGVGVYDGSGWKYYYGFGSALRAAMGANSTLTLIKDSSYAKVATFSHDLTLTSKNGAKLALSDAAQFAVPAGANLVLTNVTVCGGEKRIKDCAFKVTGGVLTLEDGAVLSDFSDLDSNKDKAYGGAIAVTSGSVTMKSGSRIENCSTIAFGGGAIWVGGANSTANLLGGTITGCSAPGGGAVCAYMKAKVNVGGDFVAEDNTKTDGATLSNILLYNNTTFTLTDELTGSVGVSYVGGADPDRNEEGAEFVTIGSGVTPAAATTSAGRFFSDLNVDLVGGYDSASQTIVWTVEEDDDGQCDINDARYSVVIDEGGANEEWRYYEWIEDAFEHLDCDATVYCAEGDWLGRDIEIRHAVRLVSFMPDYLGVQTIQRLDGAMVKIVKGGSLTLENIRFSGLSNYTDWYPYYYENTSSDGLFSVDGGSLTLEEGAVVGYVVGSASRASNAITVFNGGTVTMKSGSTVTECDNAYIDDYETSCGGGILLDHATGRFEGGAIYNCKAYRAGGLYVANGSTAYVSGDFYLGCNYGYKREFAGDSDTSDNIVVSKNSKLVLAGPLASVDPGSEDPEDPDPGYIGVNEGISSDSNCFATVEWEWTDFEELQESAAQFAHDKRKSADPVYYPEWDYWDYTVYGTAVTNGEGKAVLVWEDSLSLAKGITIDGETYRGAIPAGMSVAVPTAFSVSPTTGADGKQVLKLDGGVEGCWYTVYSTTDLTTPFTKEASVQLKAGETFEYEVDQTKGSKFYKVVAEEGLK